MISSAYWLLLRSERARSFSMARWKASLPKSISCDEFLDALKNPTGNLRSVVFVDEYSPFVIYTVNPPPHQASGAEAPRKATHKGTLHAANRRRRPGGTTMAFWPAGGGRHP
jgi:hypothetical protein